MRKISATYILTLSGPPLKNGIVVADSQGIIKEVIDTGGIVSEISGLEYYSGLLVPGFVNVNELLEPNHKGALKLTRNFNLSKGEKTEFRNTAEEDLQNKIPYAHEGGSPSLPHLIIVSYSKLKDVEGLRSNTNNCLVPYPQSDSPDENQLPDFKVLLNSGYTICIATDPLSTNPNQSMLEELKVIQQNYLVSIGELFTWSCKNGAIALGIDQWAGTIDAGKRPGINLISGVDWNRLFLTQKSKVKELIGCCSQRIK